MRTSLRRIIGQLSPATSTDEWLVCVDQIRDERTKVERLLEPDSPDRVYGFNTLLGHLDNQVSSSTDFSQLLDAHAIGPTSESNRDFFTLVSLCKVEQLHHGGTGIHPETYLDLVGSLGRLTGGGRASSASYGSGDVVPAAWWVRDLIANDVLGGTQAGDLICLINGNFYSTAFAIGVTLELCSFLAEFLARYSNAAALPVISAEQHALPDELAAFFRRPPAASTSQLPVSLRDAGPILAAITSSIDHLGESIERRLSRPSGNPLFHFTDKGAEVQSQSSFLDFTLTFALTNAIQVTHLAIGLTQRLLAHLGDADDNSIALVQPPKVGQAIVEIADLRAGMLPARFTGADSLGIEDVRDLALASGKSLQELLEIAREQLDLFDEASAAGANDNRDAQEVASASLKRLLVDAYLVRV